MNNEINNKESSKYTKYNDLDAKQKIILDKLIESGLLDQYLNPTWTNLELTEFQDLYKKASDILVKSQDIIPESCRYCKNHPSNGGSGICHCILGGLKITY